MNNKLTITEALRNLNEDENSSLYAKFKQKADQVQKEWNQVKLELSKKHPKYNICTVSEFAELIGKGEVEVGKKLDHEILTKSALYGQVKCIYVLKGDKLERGSYIIAECEGCLNDKDHDISYFICFYVSELSFVEEAFEFDSLSWIE